MAELGFLQRMSSPGFPAALPAHAFAAHLKPLPPIFSLEPRAEAARSCLLALGVTLATSEPRATPRDRSLSQSQLEGSHTTLPIPASPLKGTPVLTSQASKSAEFPQQLLPTIFQRGDFPPSEHKVPSGNFYFGVLVGIWLLPAGKQLGCH